MSRSPNGKVVRAAWLSHPGTRREGYGRITSKVCIIYADDKACHADFVHLIYCWSKSLLIRYILVCKTAKYVPRSFSTNGVPRGDEGIIHYCGGGLVWFRVTLKFSVAKVLDQLISLLAGRNASTNVFQVRIFNHVRFVLECKPEEHNGASNKSSPSL